MANQKRASTLVVLLALLLATVSLQLGPSSAGAAHGIDHLQPEEFASAQGEWSLVPGAAHPRRRALSWPTLPAPWRPAPTPLPAPETPPSPPPAPAPPCGHLHDLQPSDTCASVARAAGLSPAALAALNPALNCSALPAAAARQPLCVSATCTRSSGAAAKRDTTNTTTGGSKVLIDYVGAMGRPISLLDIPAPPAPYTHILALSFLLDADSAGTPQNGVFRPVWSPTIDPAAVRQYKLARPGARVVASLAGYSQYVPGPPARTQLVEWYAPRDPGAWVRNAVASLTGIIRAYDLDGIDVDYETFRPPRSNSSSSSSSRSRHGSFQWCMGRVVRTLKRSGAASLVTVAPYNGSDAVYAGLLARYGRYVDFVNYQFYAGNWSSVPEYVHDYARVQALFPPATRVVAGVEVGGRGLQGSRFFQAVDVLEATVEGGVPGVFLWAAEGSQNQGFVMERHFPCAFSARY